jgi:hypothetical protein
VDLREIISPALKRSAVRWLVVLGVLALLGSGPVEALAQEAPTAGPRGFVGLERLEYFERVGDPAARPGVGALLGPLLPRSLTRSSLRLRGQLVELDQGLGRIRGFGVRDFRLPAGPGPELVLRQVLDYGHPRIIEQYWALYERGARIDCWYFSPYLSLVTAPHSGPRKVLAPYMIDRVDATTGGDLVLRTEGDMFRPGGTAWRHGNDFVFSRSGGVLRFKYVMRRYLFYFPGDDDRADVAVERLVRRDGEEMLELQRLSVQRDALTRCGYLDPDLGNVQSRSELDLVARCLLAGREGIVEYRALGAPSFLERGG